MLVRLVPLGKLAISTMAIDTQKGFPAFCPGRPRPGCRRIPDLCGGIYKSS